MLALDLLGLALQHWEAVCTTKEPVAHTQQRLQTTRHTRGVAEGVEQARNESRPGAGSSYGQAATQRDAWLSISSTLPSSLAWRLLQGGAIRQPRGTAPTSVAVAGSLTWQQTCSAADPLVLERHFVVKRHPHVRSRLAVLQGAAVRLRGSSRDCAS